MSHPWDNSRGRSLPSENVQPPGQPDFTRHHKQLGRISEVHSSNVPPSAHTKSTQQKLPPPQKRKCPTPGTLEMVSCLRLLRGIMKPTSSDVPPEHHSPQNGPSRRSSGRRNISRALSAAPPPPLREPRAQRRRGKAHLRRQKKRAPPDSRSLVQLVPDARLWPRTDRRPARRPGASGGAEAPDSPRRRRSRTAQSRRSPRQSPWTDALPDTPYFRRAQS